ncbi:AAA domain-containing protein [Thermaerobacter subterraneus]|uniref:Uncharacterized protein n=1 Tax=Thermaerobacter subterraneus DSM 13965 TaxID=867903 RepID=K6PMQ3_9FIRM|nr:AAA domain-containing protein [Thermaerobacter subterraneus]EKP94172.1 Protein of unknown function (DUF559) [Thermaerobacter subterraneus DSM 13965]
MGHNEVRQRALRLFKFLLEFAMVRFPYARHLDELQWKLFLNELPNHPSLNVNWWVAGSDDTEEGAPRSDVLVRIRRPRITRPPAPPHVLQDWIKDPYDDPFKEPQVHTEKTFQGTDGRSLVVRFESDPARQRALKNWMAEWREWAKKEQPARQAMKVYERFHELYGVRQREGERYELILGDGILFWRWGTGSIYFPLITLPVQLDFDPNVPEFVVRETGQNPDFYSALLRDTPVTNPDVPASIRDDIARGRVVCHPLETLETSAFLKRVARSLSADGEFLDRPVDPRSVQGHAPHIWRSAVLFLRPRAQTYARSIERIIADLQNRESIPSALSYVIGLGGDEQRNSRAHDQVEPPNPLEVDLSEDILFTKPWNQEQVQIASRLDRYGCVVVQGPPGTGKTHTIANLIGHLLAQGKSVLVTAHTSKALNVVRNHIPEALRSLVVSLLDNDLASRRELEDAVYAITERLNDYAPGLLREAETLDQQRKKLIQEIKSLRLELADAVAGEYRDIVVGGNSYTPSQAARLIAEGTGRHDWIPGPVIPGAALPLRQDELIELYYSNESVSPNDERAVAETLPDPDDLITPEQFNAALGVLERPVEGHRPEWWSREHQGAESAVFEDLAAHAESIGKNLCEAQNWQIALVEEGQIGTFSGVIEELLEQVDDIERKLAINARLLVEHRPVLPSGWTLEEAEHLANEIARLAEASGGRITFAQRIRYRRFIQAARVAAGVPTTADHFKALAAQSRLMRDRQRLLHSWEYLITAKGGPSPESLGTEPERTLRHVAPELRRWLHYNETIQRLWSDLRERGFVGPTTADVGLVTDMAERWRALGEFLAGPIAEAVRAAAMVGRQNEARKLILDARARLEELGDGQLIVELRDSLSRLDGAAYRKAYDRLSELHRRQKDIYRRQELLKRLEAVAPAWAAAIRKREGLHGQTQVPGDVTKAWLWRQLYEEILRRSDRSVEELQARLQARMQHLYEMTSRIVEKRTWGYRIQQTTPEQKQALVGWLNTVRRIGKGTGKSAPRLRARAAELLSEAKDAVPVWVMPLARVAEQINPAKTHFDVVIIDEASQCDALALIALYLADQVVVVGDHEQVSPEGVGMDLGVLEQLQREYLAGIPNDHLYDGRRSIYDIARESFGGGVLLTEHFRCVPEIIQFSNVLSYQGRIRPLRESANVRIKPPVVPHRVNGTSDKLRNESEARAIVSLVLAMMQHPAYKGKTIGVISMVGEEQARYIEQLLRRFRIERPKEFEGCKLLCGTPAQFQGDERDVVLLSMVDSPQPGKQLPLRSDERFKQRFNVAASRARDQLWVVYSLDPARDLREDDLRRRLIEYAVTAYSNPAAVLRMVEIEEERVESPFEREVFEWLVRAGYHVRSQYAAGCYRIDLVVEGDGGRVAIECDGDRYHTLEQIPYDLARQAVLERMGWRFIRIRGSEFFRNKTGTMERVIRQIKALGIEPSVRQADVASADVTASPYALVDEIRRMAQEIERDMMDSEMAAD